MKVSNRTLFAIAGAVWGAAGINIAVIGLGTYGALGARALVLAGLLAVSAAVCGVFWTRVFAPLLRRHTARIAGYGERRQPFWRFFDRPSFIVMAVMMSGGIALRASGIAPAWFIACFYTGLGIALTFAGTGFLRAFARHSRTAAVS